MYFLNYKMHFSLLLLAFLSCLLHADCSLDGDTSKSEVSGNDNGEIKAEEKAAVATEDETSLGTPETSGKSESKFKLNFRRLKFPKPQDNDGSSEPNNEKRPDNSVEWNSMAESIVSELKLSGLTVDTCLPGLRVETDSGKRILSLTRGKIAGFTKFYHRNDAKVVGQTPGVIEFQMNFAFENLRIEYFYEYVPNSLHQNKKRQGPVILELKGESVISLSAAVYKFQLESSPEAHQCPLAITDMKITKLGLTLKTLKVHSSFFTRKFYFFMKILSPTVRGVTRIVKSIQENIKEDVSDALREVIGTAVKGLKQVCTMQQKWKSRDCDVVNNLGIRN